MGINQFDPDPDPHFQFLCERGAKGGEESGGGAADGGPERGRGRKRRISTE